MAMVEGRGRGAGALPGWEGLLLSGMGVLAINPNLVVHYLCCFCSQRRGR